MDFFSKFRRPQSSRKTGKKSSAAPMNLKSKPGLETLEDRMLLTCNLISGHVFNDANANGLFDLGETPIANSQLELRNATGQVIGTTLTDANGYYEFAHDSTVNTTPVTKEHTVSIPLTLAGFSITDQIEQFDPAKGELLEVEIIHNGSITSDIRAENSSTRVGANITGTVSGKMTLSGPGFTLDTTVNSNAGSFVATAFDGAIDFSGTSGKAFAPSSAMAATKSIKLTGAQMAGFIGTGMVGLTEDVEVNSTATGGGNLLAGINSSATATYTVRYKYVPDNCLDPGAYTVVQKEQPRLPGSTERYMDGQESIDGIIQLNSVGTDQIRVTLTDTNAINNNFGEVAPASLAGNVYFDQNNSGTRDVGEAGIAGASVTLSGADDLGQSVLRTVVTDANGTYRFDNLRPGMYTVTEQQPAGYLDGKDAAGSHGGVAGDDLIDAINLPGGAIANSYNFGELRPGSLAGFVFTDVNNNGSKDVGEPGIAGVSVTLSGFDEAGPVSRTMLTGADGSYRFDNLRAGTYTITETQPAGYLDGQDRIGTPGGATANDQFSNIALGHGQQGTNNNFGEIRPSSLAGNVWHDADNDGVKDAGESGIAGATLTLTGSDDMGAVTRTTTTAADGAYRFDDLRPGFYSIQETQPDNYLDGIDTVGTPGGILSNDRVSNINLGQGVAGVNHNFGELTPGKLSGFVYSDLNQNGVKDPGENGVANVPVSLTGTDDRGPVSLTALTAADGSYKFENLRPGVYALQETQPNGYQDGQESLGSLGGSISNDRFSNVQMQQGQNGENYNFGEINPTELSGKVWHDVNDNAVIDPGEEAISGVTVKLTGVTATGPVVRETITAADGTWRFDNLMPGTYNLEEMQPVGYLDGKEAMGSAGGAQSNDKFSAISINEGTVGRNYNFGERIATDVLIDKVVSTAVAEAGSTLTYTLAVVNNGPSDAEDVRIEDTLPPGVTFVSASATGWLVQQMGSTLIFTRDRLAVGERSEITYTAVAPLTPGTYPNVARVTTSTLDINLLNNQDDAVFTVPQQPTKAEPPPQDCQVVIYSYSTFWLDMLRRNM